MRVANNIWLRRLVLTCIYTIGVLGVLASGGGGGGSDSDPTPTTPPTAPTGLNATATSSNSISLGWMDNSIDETSFVVQRSTTSGSGFATIATLGANTNDFTDTTGLLASTTYYYRVYATNGAGDSGFSNEAFATTDAIPSSPPIAPTGLGATATSSSSISLSWTDNSIDETNFVVQRSTTSGSGFTTVATLNVNTTSYDDTTGLSASATYYYRVYATNATGDSGFSNEAFATTDTNILVSWDGNPETAVNRSGGGYKVYYSSNSGFNLSDGGVTEIDVPYSSGVSAPTSIIITLSPGVYYLRIAAYSTLNAPGSVGGSASAASPQVTLTVP